MSKYKAIIDLGRDLARGAVGNYTKEEANETLRKAIFQIIGCEDGVYNQKQFRRNKLNLFEFLEEVLDERFENDIREQFERFVEYRSVALGDTLRFRKAYDELFEVSMISGGNNNLRRQRIENAEYFDVSTDVYGVKVYDELDRFLAGRIDWVGMIDRIERSFTALLINQIYLGVKDAYSGLDAPYYKVGSFDLDEFLDLVAHVEAATGQKPMVLGTRKALAKVQPQYINIGAQSVEDRNNLGFFPTVEGVTLVQLPQGHIPGTDTFAIDEDFLLVIPNSDEKIIKMVTEGDTQIKEVGGQDNADDSQEITVRKRYGLAVISNSKYGVYILS